MFSGVELPFGVDGMLKSALSFIEIYGVWLGIAVGSLIAGILLYPVLNNLEYIASQFTKEPKHQPIEYKEPVKIRELEMVVKKGPDGRMYMSERVHERDTWE